MAFKYGFCDGFTDLPCPSPLSSLPPSKGILGCGELTAFVTSQCGAPRLCQLTDASLISWGRKLDAVSEAQVVVPTGGSADSECCECLSEVEPWCHELHIFRNGVFVWGGPITKVTYGYEQVTIDARDVLVWTQFRVLECIIDYTPTGSGSADISTIAHTLLNVAFAESDPCVLDFIRSYPTTLTNFSAFLHCFEKTVQQQLDDLASSGLDYTVLGRSILLGGSDLPVRALGVLHDEMILGDISIVKDGLLAGNRFFVTYQDDDNPVQCASLVPGVDITHGCPCKCPAISEGGHECYGLLERLLNDASGFDYNAAKQTADAYLAACRIVPRSIEFSSGTRISPETPWDINDMVPGQRVDVALTGLCIPIYQSFRLLEMNSKQEGLGEEQVDITLGSVNQFTGTV